VAMIFIFPTPIAVYLGDVPELHKTDQYLLEIGFIKDELF
jgi:hypothetical protein